MPCCVAAQLRMPYGTPMTLLPGRDFILGEMMKLAQDFGLDSKDFATNLDPQAVIIDRLQTGTGRRQASNNSDTGRCNGDVEEEQCECHCNCAEGDL